MLIIPGVLALLASLILLSGAVVVAWSQSRKRALDVTAPGTVVELNKRFFRPGSGGVYVPTVEFQPAGAALIRFEASAGTMPASHQVGQVVRVRYKPGSPQSADIDSALTRWLLPGCMAGLGLLFGPMSLVFLGLHFLLMAGG